MHLFRFIDIENVFKHVLNLIYIHLRLFIFLFLLLNFSSCQKTAPKSFFTLLDAEITGLDFENQLQETDSFNIIQYLYSYNGAGIGAGDLNGDDLPDLVFNANQSHPRVYLNISKEKIQFRDISKELQLDTIKGWGTGVAMADVNGDGLLDIYLTQVGNYKNFKGSNKLLIHQGIEEGLPSFENQTEEYGLSFSGLSTQAAFFDYDLDGDLDMYLLNHSTHRTSNYGRSKLRLEVDTLNGDRLYRNDGHTFSNVTKSAGIYASKIGYGLGIAISDLDNNGYPDIYIGNDFHENDYLYWNEGGQFTEGIQDAVSRTSQFSMGVDIADVNNDGFTDILSLDMMPEQENLRKRSVGYDPYNIFLFKKSYGYHDQFPLNHLQINNGQNRPVFSELAAFAGIESTDWSWSCLWQDYDLDGNKDLFISNGILRRPNDLDYLNYIANPLVQKGASDLDLAAQMPSGKVPNYLYVNDGDLSFRKMQGIGKTSLSTGASYADLDNDGDLDIITSNINEPAFIYENQARKIEGNNYIKLKLKGLGNNTFGIGVKAVIHTGDQTISLENFPQKGFMSSVEPVINAGVGKHTQIDKIEIFWPSGKYQTLQNQAVNQTLELKEAEAIDSKEEHQAPIQQIFTTSNISLDYVHQENAFNDLENEKLQAQLYSKEGPALATADINGDGQIEIFLGGAKGRSPVLYQMNDDAYQAIQADFWNQEAAYEDTDALFFDADGDGDQDLYVASAGNEYTTDHPALIDRLYLNDGQGYFTKQKISGFNIPFENSSCVAASDFDQDGDMDLFVGSRVDKGSYATVPPSYILENDGQGNFDKKRSNYLGMVTDAAWGDVDGDGDEDLVIVGDWMPIVILLNKQGSFSKIELPKSHGWWRSVQLADLDNDSHLDIIAGNFGINSDIEPSTKMPLQLRIGEQNQKVFMTYGNGQAVPSADELVKQIPVLKKDFSTYKDYAQLNANKLFSDTKFDTRTVTTFETAIYFNEGKASFVKQPIPRAAQISSTNAILIEDVNQDGLKDLVFAGNEFHLNTRLGKKDASLGILLLQNPKRQFEVLAPVRSGLNLEGMIRQAVVISHQQSRVFLFAANNGVLQHYVIR